MRINSQAVLERLVDLLYENLDKPACDVLGMLQTELRVREQAEAERVRSMADNTLNQTAKITQIGAQNGHSYNKTGYQS